MSSLNKAVEIAFKAHAGQVDRNGQPYIGHVLRVMNMGRNEEEKICGVLHDVVEDTDVTFDDLRKEGFSESVIAALKCLTKDPPDEDYEKFINRISLNRLAVSVKLNDLTDNMDVRRLDEINEKDIARFNKYLNAYRKLSKLINK
jgi:(p)ppGpp synthase/HD superfamily hydrolase